MWVPMFVARLLSLKRSYFNKENLFFELGLGLYYRPKGLYAGDFTGYKKGVLPALLISVGYSF